MMSDRKRPPSSASVTTSQQSSDNQPYSLVIRKQPHHVYAGETFQIEYALKENQKTGDSSPPTNLQLRAVLDDDGSSHELQILQAPRLSPSRQTGELVARIRGLSGSFGIRLEATGLPSVVTQQIRIVASKLTVHHPQEWSVVWYKDEGGRDKGMEVTVRAHNGQGQPAISSNPLQMQLCYESKMPVMNQDIFRLLGRKKIVLDASGEAKIRYRVEDVSKNHQGQNFVLKISLDDTMAPCWTAAVAIRSKRNKRQRTPGPLLPVAAAAVGAAAVGPRSDDDQVREAVQGILRWSEEVVSDIYPLQWQVMGYAHNPDGSLDYSRPYHNMQNPNPAISRILSIYNESTREQLQVVQNAFPVNNPFASPPLPPPPPQTPIQPPPQPKHDDFYEPYPTYYRELSYEAMKPQADESRVEYVLAKHYKSFTTGETLGFPAFSREKELLGFFRQSDTCVRNFSSVQQYQLTPQELQDASLVLQESCHQKSPSVHSLKDLGSLASMLDHALVYDWSKDITK